MAVGTPVKLSNNLDTPRDSKPSDYPAVGPMGAAGEASGAGQLVKKSADPASPADFKVTQAKSDSTSVKTDCYVDIKSGEHY